MMNFLFCIFVILRLAESNTFGHAVAKVCYDMTIVHYQVPIYTQSELYIYKNNALFISHKGKYPGKFIKWNDLEDQIYTDELGNQVYKNYRTNQNHLRENVMSRAYVSVEAMPKMNWRLGIDTKIILGYKCQAATTSFRGRKYIAWFAPEIPISDGPWKFYGLPGLILEIIDEKEQVSFKATCIEIPTQTDRKEELLTSKKDRFVPIEKFRNAMSIEQKKWSDISKSESRGIQDFEIEWLPYKNIEISYDN